MRISDWSSDVCSSDLTLYDPFIMRGLDALNYACYQDARFILVATPSGVTLAPEGGAHQSVSTPLIGLAQDGLASFEPAFVDELSTILAWSFDYRSDEHTSELQSLMRNSYAVFCLKKKNHKKKSRIRAHN